MHKNSTDFIFKIYIHINKLKSLKKFTIRNKNYCPPILIKKKNLKKRENV